MKRNKRGISLIVLVITIIVMIILASAIIISLSNSGVINRANEAVKEMDLAQIKHIATLAWAEAYYEYSKGNQNVNFKEEVETALSDNNVNLEEYVIIADEKGVDIVEAKLGNLITNPKNDYGKSVSYTVTVNDTTYDDWQVFYEDELNGYIFLILKDYIEVENIDSSSGNNVMPLVEVTQLVEKQNNLYNIFKLGQVGYELNNTYANSKAVAWLVSGFDMYANSNLYGEYVIGAIGGPTLELLAAGYNSKYKESLQITPIVDKTYNDGAAAMYNGNYGYFLNELTTGLYNLQKDTLYFPADYYYHLAAPAAYADGGIGEAVLLAGREKNIIPNGYYYMTKIRPVVCLSSDIPAKPVEGGYALIK